RPAGRRGDAAPRPSRARELHPAVGEEDGDRLPRGRAADRRGPRAGVVRDARDAAPRRRKGPSRARPPRAERPGLADHVRPRELLGGAVPEGTTRTRPPLSPPPLARGPARCGADVEAPPAAELKRAAAHPAKTSARVGGAPLLHRERTVDRQRTRAGQ